MKKISVLPVLVFGCLVVLASGGWAQAVDTDADGVNDYREGKDGTDPNNVSSYNPLSKGLVAFFAMGGNSDDESGCNQTLISSNVIYTTDRLGLPNAAAYFNGTAFMRGNSRVQLAESAESHTVSVWVKTEDRRHSCLAGYVNALEGSSSGSRGYQLMTSWPEGTGKYRFMQGNASAQGGWDYAVENGRTVADGSWHHLVGVRENGVARIYLDGVLQDKTTSVLPTFNQTSRLVVGWDGFSPKAKAAIDELRIYNRGLSTAEVAQLYTSESGHDLFDADGDGVNNYREGKDGTDPENRKSYNPLSKGLVAYYPLDGSATDESGYNRPGVINGGSHAAPNRNGKKDRSLQLLSGGGMVAGPTPFDVNSDYTLSLWVYGNPDGTEPVQQLVATAPDTEGGIIIRYHTPDFTFEGWGYSSGWYGGDADPPPWGGIVSNAATFKDQWNHLVLTRRGQSTSFYINGILRSRISPTPVTTDSGNIYFGEFQYNFEGSLDDVRIYNRGFNAAQVAQLYYAESLDAATKLFLSKYRWLSRNPEFSRRIPIAPQSK
jgi:hypothetical protein